VVQSARSRRISRYFDVRAGDRVVHEAAWHYPLLGFYNETLDIDVDGVRLPKPITELSRSK
jgi:hypothetical protein